MRNSAYFANGSMKTGNRREMMDTYKKSGKAVIFCWSESDRLPFEISKDDFIICADSGSDYAARLGISPDLVLGDFDSSSKPGDNSDCKTIVLPAEKDDTDAMYAARCALANGYSRIFLAGGLGGRLDHTLGALSVMRFLNKNGAVCEISDGYTAVFQIPSGRTHMIPYEENIRYISVFPSEERSSGVNIKGLKYPLNNYELRSDFPIGVSNEPIPGTDAEIKAGDGDLIVILIRKDGEKT